MKSLALIGTPSDQTAFGLIWYTTVCGFVLTTLALVTTSVLSVGLRSGWTVNTRGSVWSRISVRTNSLSPASSELKPGTSSSRANVSVPPLLTEPVPKRTIPWSSYSRPRSARRRPLRPRRAISFDVNREQFAA